MNNAVVQQSLIEIEENLKNLQSAKNQVEEIIKTNGTLISSVLNIAQSINSLHKEFSNDKTSFNESIKNSLSIFKDTFDKQSKDIINRSDELSKRHISSVDNTIEKLHKFQAEISKAEMHIQNLDFEKNFNELNTNIENVVELINNQKKIAKKTQILLGIGFISVIVIQLVIKFL